MAKESAFVSKGAGVHRGGAETQRMQSVLLIG
jgi:hypothetical protein